MGRPQSASQHRPWQGHVGDAPSRWNIAKGTRLSGCNVHADGVKLRLGTGLVGWVPVRPQRGVPNLGAQFVKDNRYAAGNGPYACSRRRSAVGAQQSIQACASWDRWLDGQRRVLFSTATSAFRGMPGLPTRRSNSRETLTRCDWFSNGTVPSGDPPPLRPAQTR